MQQLIFNTKKLKFDKPAFSKLAPNCHPFANITCTPVNSLVFPSSSLLWMEINAHQRGTWLIFRKLTGHHCSRIYHISIIALPLITEHGVTQQRLVKPSDQSYKMRSCQVIYGHLYNKPEVYPQIRLPVSLAHSKSTKNMHMQNETCMLRFCRPKQVCTPTFPWTWPELCWVFDK